MSTEKNNRSSGTNAKSRRSSRSRKTTPKDPAVETTPVAVPEKTAASEPTVTEEVAPIEPIVSETTAPEAVPEITPAESSEGNDSSNNSVDIQEGAVMAADKEQQSTKTPSVEGQLVTQASESASLVPTVASTYSLMGGVRPIMTSNLHIAEMVQNRPVFESELQIYETINVSGLRPVLASPFHFIGSLDAAGHRPIGENEFEIADTMNVSGVRPIAASALHITEMLTASRPIASNDIDDSAMLMGYID